MKPLLHMQEITKRYSGVTALNNVELTLNAGEVLALVGENGAGKSTLIKVLGGIISRDSGTILIDGKEADIKNPIDAQKCGIRSVQQHFSLIPTMSVAENLYYNDFPLKLGRRIDFKAMNKKRQSFCSLWALETLIPPLSFPISPLPMHSALK